MKIMVLLLVLTSSVGCMAKEGFLEARGSELYLDGKVYREIGFNKYDLLLQSILCQEEQWRQTSEKEVTRNLDEMKRHGFKIIRFMGGPFYPTDFDHYFFHKDIEYQAAKRKIYFQRFDRILDLCDQFEIKVIPSLIWWNAGFADLGGHSMHEGVVNPQSPARQKMNEYIAAVVDRYKNRPTIAMWELGNEWNLQADLQFKDGAIGNYERQMAPPVIARDDSNNFNSEELARMTQELAELIKSIDKNHLVTTGHSSPRAASMHLLKAAKANQPLDWTHDTQEELTEYLQMTHPDPIDVISIHYYEEAMECYRAEGGHGNPDNLGLFMQASQQIGKPMMIGEIGMYKKMAEADQDYRRPGCLPYIEACLQEIVKNKYPLTLYWTYHDSNIGRGEQHWSLEYGKTDEVLKRIEQANRDIKK